MVKEVDEPCYVRNWQACVDPKLARGCHSLRETVDALWWYSVKIRAYYVEDMPRVSAHRVH